MPRIGTKRAEWNRRVSWVVVAGTVGRDLANGSGPRDKCSGREVSRAAGNQRPIAPPLEGTREREKEGKRGFQRSCHRLSSRESPSRRRGAVRARVRRARACSPARILVRGIIARIARG